MEVRPYFIFNLQESEHHMKSGLKISYVLYILAENIITERVLGISANSEKNN